MTYKILKVKGFMQQFCVNCVSIVCQLCEG